MMMKKRVADEKKVGEFIKSLVELEWSKIMHWI